MAYIVEWFFGRGLSIECGLTWRVPQEWSTYPRDEQITAIIAAITSEMSSTYVDTTVISQFLFMLANHTVSPWRHRFHTTNWDYLLQREIVSLGHIVRPSWSAETHVYHLNGSVETLSDNSRRSVFVLESDSPQARIDTIEGNIAFNRFIWSQTFMVVGMSFECEVDKYLLSALMRIQDELPIRESFWVVLNPDADALSATSARLKTALPRANIVNRESTFSAWLDAQLPELQSLGALAF